MRIFNKLFSVVALALVVMLSSCKDDDEKASKTQILTSKSWVVAKMEMGFGDQVTDITDDMEDCEKDNSIKFNSDGKYEENVGADDCAGDEANISGNWNWNSDETVLTILVHDETIEGKLLSINSSTVQFQTTEVWDLNSDGIEDDEVKIITTLKAK